MTEKDLLDQPDYVDDSTLKEIPPEKQKPVMGSFEWNDYALEQLHEKEFRSHKGIKYPTTDGLKRLVYKLLGKIVSSQSKVVNAGNHENDFTVTVEHTIEVLPWDGDDKLHFTGVGDVNARNLDSPFNKYLTANCSTRALGRACRDALMLRTCVAEELSNVAETDMVEDPEDAQFLHDSQKAAIKSICKKNGVDVDKFIRLGAFPHKSLEEVRVGTARKMISILNGYQSGKEIPKEILL